MRWLRRDGCELPGHPARPGREKCVNQRPAPKNGRALRSPREQALLELGDPLQKLLPNRSSPGDRLELPVNHIRDLIGHLDGIIQAALGELPLVSGPPSRGPRGSLQAREGTARPSGRRRRRPRRGPLLPPALPQPPRLPPSPSRGLWNKSAPRNTSGNLGPHSNEIQSNPQVIEDEKTRRPSFGLDRPSDLQYNRVQDVFSGDRAGQHASQRATELRAPRPTPSRRAEWDA